MRLMNVNYCTEDATTVTASSSSVHFPVSNLKHPFRSKRWRSTAVASESVVFDMATAEAINSVVLLWPKEDGILLSNTAVVTIQANATDVWTAPAVSQVLTISNDYVMASHYFTTDQSYRYWRVLIADPGNANGYLQLGVVWLGKSIAIQNAQNGFTYSLVDRTKTTVNDFGHSYADEYPLVASLDFSYEFLDYADIQTLENAFRTNGNRDPVMVVIDAEESVFDKDHIVLYGKFKNSFDLKHVMSGILNTGGITVTEIS